MNRIAVPTRRRASILAAAECFHTEHFSTCEQEVAEAIANDAAPCSTDTIKFDEYGDKDCKLVEAVHRITRRLMGQNVARVMVHYYAIEKSRINGRAIVRYSTPYDFDETIGRPRPPLPSH